MSAAHGIIVHQHLYQPPREDPWMEAVRVEPSAAPDHDWNARIDRECYARLAAATTYRRDPRARRDDADATAGIARVVNLYAWCSFDVGATLCEWLDGNAPDTLRAMQQGDAASVARWGHGNAIAAPYHHVILPLASPRDRSTELRWGIRDFRQRFGRDPEGLWLPECAADEDTLDAVAAAGIRFTILAPYQVEGHDGRGLPVRWRGARGRELIIVPYDGAVAGDVAFGGLLRDPRALAQRLAGALPGDADRTSHESAAGPLARCVTLATDGETFGHHHRGGEVALAEALALVARTPGRRLLNTAALVAHTPPVTDVRLVSPSAWSCAHGVERWRSNCGCRLDGSKPPAQQWRGPLREALTWLAAQHEAAFERDGRALFTDDPWDVRDAYGAVVARDGAPLEAFARAALPPQATDAQVARARELLEGARASLRTFTSCAWFFDEVDRIEVRQVLRYAARALELGGAGSRLLPEFVERLADATNGAPGAPSAADVFVRDAMPARAPVVAAAAAAIALIESGLPASPVAVWDVYAQADTTAVDGMSLRRVQLRHRRTGTVSDFEGHIDEAHTAHVVRLRHLDQAGTSGAWYDIPVHEFPEAAARALLSATASGPHALD
ncbi:MAG: DUF3536 domain-containing protein [Gemmatimonadetes bacterium]|nr:DUF3536 domain-containing protein [Gemmatimonadota bacterium]